MIEGARRLGWRLRPPARRTRACAIALSLAMARAACAQSAPPDPGPPAPAPKADRRDRLSYSLDSGGLGTLFKHVLGNVALDQKPIWTSPFHMTETDAKWWVLFGAGTGVFINYDRRLSNEIPRGGFPVTFGKVMSPVGEYWALYPAAVAFSLAGKDNGDQTAFETGGLLIQALTDSAVVVGALKLAAGRQRPYEG